MRKKGKMVWPEHISWWDRHEWKINVLLWGIFFGLLIIGRNLFIDGAVTLQVGSTWVVLFIIDLFLLSFISNSVR